MTAIFKPLFRAVWRPLTGLAKMISGYILAENGDFITAENGDRIIQE